jgi:hypothetical protein
MKIGVLSDTHLSRVTGELVRIVEEVFGDTDLILHAGDIGSGDVLDYLDAAGVIAVRGNTDTYGGAERLPGKRVIRAGGFALGLIHGYGAYADLAPRMEAEFEAIDCLIFGHSHQPLSLWQGGRLYFNPGSATTLGRNRVRTVGLLHLNEVLRGEILPLSEENKP